MSTPRTSPSTHAPCPHCGGLVRVEALKCRHCRRPVDAPSWLGARIALDFWGPVLLLVGGVGLAAGLLRLGGGAATPLPADATAAVPLPIGAPRARPAVGGASELPPMDGQGPAAPTGPGGPVARAAVGLVGDPEHPPPVHWQPRYRRPDGSTGTDASAADAPGRGAAATEGRAPGTPSADSATPATAPNAPLVRGAPPSGAEPAPRGPARPRALHSALFGYGLRLGDERNWSLAFSGTSRDALVREDGTARLQLWVELSPGRRQADAATCLRDYVTRLEKRLRSAGLSVSGQGSGTRAGRHGLTLHTAERRATGKGPRRHAGRYQVAFAAAGELCFGFEGFAAQPASRRARAEVREAFASFDVDGGARSQARTDATRRRLLQSAGSPSPAGLLDLGTSLPALFPDEATGWRMLGEAYLAGGRAARALAALERARTGREEGSGDEAKMSRFTLDTLIADGHARLKKWDAAARALEDARAYFPDHPFLAYAEACLQAQQGRGDQALRKLESALGAWPARAAPPRLPHGLGTQVALARRDSRLAALQKEPSFEILLRRFEARARKASE